MPGRVLFLRLAAVALALLGLARGAGGVVLATGGAAAVESVRVPLGTARVLAAGLCLVAILALVASVQLWRTRPGATRLATGALCLFVIDGLINGQLLFGEPTDRGTLANLVAAGLIGSLLLAGRNSAGPTKPEKT